MLGSHVASVLGQDRKSLYTISIKKKKGQVAACGDSLGKSRCVPALLVL